MRAGAFSLQIEAWPTDDLRQPEKEIFRGSQAGLNPARFSYSAAFSFS